MAKLFRGGAQGGKDVGVDAVAGQHLGGHSRELIAPVPAVVGNRHGHRAVVVGCEIIGQALGRHGHHGGIHPVGARAHDAPHASRSKGQILVEGLLERGGVGIIQHGLHGISGGRIVGFPGPGFGPEADVVEIHVRSVRCSKGKGRAQTGFEGRLPRHGFAAQCLEKGTFVEFAVSRASRLRGEG